MIGFPLEAVLPVAAWGAGLCSRCPAGQGRAGAPCQGNRSQSNQHVSMRSAASAHLWMFMFSFYCSVKQIIRVLGKRLTLRLVLGVGKNAALRGFLTTAVG